MPWTPVRRCGAGSQNSGLTGSKVMFLTTSPYLHFSLMSSMNEESVNQSMPSAVSCTWPDPSHNLLGYRSPGPSCPFPWPQAEQASPNRLIISSLPQCEGISIPSQVKEGFSLCLPDPDHPHLLLQLAPITQDKSSLRNIIVVLSLPVEASAR